MSVTCRRCGLTWPRDPAKEVPCPTCHAKAGAPCKRPSGHRAADVHAARDRAAMLAGFYMHCTGPREVAVER